MVRKRKTKNTKNQKNKDPYYAREAEKYAQPIPSREYIMKYLEKLGKPASFEQLLSALKLNDEDESEALRRRLKAMTRDGQIFRNRGEGFCLVSKLDLIQGRVQGHRDGFGFLIPHEKGEDLYLSPRQMRLVFHGDDVLVRRTGFAVRGRPEGVIVKVIARHNEHYVGKFKTSEGVAYIIPENKRICHEIIIPEKYTMGAIEEQVVKVEITEYPSAHRYPVGKVVDILGEHMDPGMEISVAINNYDIPNSWPKDLLQQIENLSPHVKPSDKKDRVDLREQPFVTIDSEDAKDFDDAVFCEPMSRGAWRLYVAIADVSHYVEPGTPLDIEAENRGTSVYFPGQVVPMLPEVLSNGLCSLKPKVDRLALVCEMSISSKGKLRSSKFYNAVIRSHARMTYKNVAKILVDKDKKLRTQYKKLVPDLDNLYQLYQILHQKRLERGAIDFAIPEPYIIFDQKRKIKHIAIRERNDAHRLIEECMLQANVATAQYLLKKGLPILFRNHAKPESKKLKDCRTYLGGLGLSLAGGKEPDPGEYNKLLNKILDRPDFATIQTVLLRSLSQAMYESENSGHFGLAFEAYTHYTSPIRRYPDLLVHRAIKFILSKQKKKHYLYDHNKMTALGEHCSMTERRADDATRDVVDWLKCEFMLDKLGEIFNGTVSSVTEFGLFVSLKDIYVDGLIHISSLQNDYYIYDGARQKLVGESSGISYRLGDEVVVQLARVDLDERKIDFVLYSEESLENQNSTKKPKPNSKRTKKPRKPRR